MVSSGAPQYNRHHDEKHESCHAEAPFGTVLVLGIFLSLKVFQEFKQFRYFFLGINKNRYSGKTQKQIVEFVRENYVKRQAFQR